MFSRVIMAEESYLNILISFFSSLSAKIQEPITVNLGFII